MANYTILNIGTVEEYQNKIQEFIKWLSSRW
jgi:hypothetical protein